MPEILIYSRPACGYCDLAKDLFRRKGLAFSEVNIAEDQSRLSEMVERSGGRMTFPQIFVGETHVGGYTDLAGLDRRGGLDALLNA